MKEIKNIMNAYSELAFFPSQAQSDAYNMTFLKSTKSKKSDILVAYFRPVMENSVTKFCCFIYHLVNNEMYVKPLFKCINFVYLPTSDIVCLDALYDEIAMDHIVGVGFVKDDGTSYFNIYGSGSQEKLSECCLSFSELTHVPMQAAHTYYLSAATGELQWAFILSHGNVCRPPCTSVSLQSATEPGDRLPFRVFAQLCDAPCKSISMTMAGNSNVIQRSRHTSTSSSDVSQRNAPTQNFVNNAYGAMDTASVQQLFPEFAYVPKITVLYMDFVIVGKDPLIRLSAFGGENGWIGAGMVNISTSTLIKFHSFTHDSPITCVKLFQLHPSPEDSNDEFQCLDKSITDCSAGHTNVDRPPIEKSPDSYSLLVCSGFEPAVVYMDVFRLNALGLANQFILPQSANFDHVNCACVGDLDFDGTTELMIGTFGQMLLVYKWIEAQDAEFSLDETDIANGQFELVHNRKLVGPVHSLSCSHDLLGDGTRCVAALTSQGLQVLQCSPAVICETLLERLDLLKQLEKPPA